MHNILFTEPYSQDTVPTYVDFQVTDKMYQQLLQEPKAFNNPDQDANAYVFGPLFPLESYRFISNHANDGAQTGFIDVDLFDKNIAKDIMDLVLEEYEKEHDDLSWRSRAALLRVRERAPFVLFIGETVGGDVGAELYAHFDERGNIDSLIIDNHFFFSFEDAEE